MSIANEMFELMKELWPIPRSLTGEGVRETLSILRRGLPELEVLEVPSGTRCFDWTVPMEWRIRDAYILDPDGKKIADFKENNLHLVGYSVPQDREISLEELQEHLHSLPDQPDALPYRTSYYEEDWGFCVSHHLRQSLSPGRYRVVIDSDLFPGNLTYGELVLPGNSKEEIFLSTYVCHPSMANNELSGPVVTAFLAAWLRSLPDRKYTYRVVFVPETIGSIAYLSRHLTDLKKHVVAGLNITCVGDEAHFSYLPSRLGGTLADRVAVHVLEHLDPDWVRYSYLDRGSDERQYCSPGVDLPVCSVMRSKYGEYPEYHTSLDNLDFVSAEGLAGSYHALRRCLECLERNETLEVTLRCEPQLVRWGILPALPSAEQRRSARRILDLLAYCDGRHSLLEVAEILGRPMWSLYEDVDELVKRGLLKTR